MMKSEALWVRVRVILLGMVFFYQKDGIGQRWKG